MMTALLRSGLYTSADRLLTACFVFIPLNFRRYVCMHGDVGMYYLHVEFGLSPDIAAA